MGRVIMLIVLMGAAYVNIEVFYNALSTWSWALKGSSSLWMFLVGGLAGVTLGAFNEKNSLCSRLPYFLQVVLGGLVITALEFVFGVILNLWLGFDIWDYSGSMVNLLGQIDLWHSLCWILLTPTVFWVDDILRHYLYDAPRPDPWLSYYTDLL